MYWMIANRAVQPNGLGDDFDSLTFWTNDNRDNLEKFETWKKIEKADDFRNALIAIANKFPDPLVVPPEQQKHITIFVHGFDTNWISAVQHYGKIVENLFSGDNSMGECILFTWPSKGSLAGYLPDRSEARKSAEDFALVLSDLYDWMAKKQQDAAEDPKNGCRAQTSLIAHSMGNYVVQNAMNFAWTRKNRPLLMSLINQYVMAAADVDNDIFRAGRFGATWRW